MISASRSAAATVLSRPTLASFFLLALLGVPPRARALSPQTSGAPSAEQQPAQNPTKKNSANTASDSAASKNEFSQGASSLYQRRSLPGLRYSYCSGRAPPPQA